nr:uncharacterized protein LOC129271715 [Lytechinus pictus]
MSAPTKTANEARTTCQSYGGDLALIKTVEVNNFLRGILPSTAPSTDFCYFFGLRRSGLDAFAWIDGTPLEFSAWITPEPNDASGNEDCASLNPSTSSMEWNDISCDTEQSFICDRYQYVPEYKWSELDGTLYYVSQSSKTSYSFARMFCQEQGGDLAQPKTEEINDHLIDLAAGNAYWFGLSITTNSYQWIDGTTLANNVFPTWSNGVGTLFENEKCVHQQAKNGWRKLPCGSYLRFACEKPTWPRPVPPMRIMSATTTPYGGGLENSSYLCLQGSEDEEILSLSTRRFFRLPQAVNFDSYEAPGVTSTPSSVALRQTLPHTTQGFGFFVCSLVTASKRTSSPLGVLLSTRQLQPTDGRLTITVHVGDNVTLSVMSTTGMEGEDGIKWRRLIDFDWTGILIGESSNSLSHTIQSVSLLDAGVYLTFIEGTLGEHQHSFLRLIVKECPDGRWNPPSCDRLCDNCYNGGICHESSGTCICPPGHAGENCLRACGRHTFGWDCEFECGAGQLLDKCAESQICLPDPYGCNCLAGYTGIYCNNTCTDGWYGADCRQSCHCADGRDCDDATGECPGDCSGDWSGPACQVPSVCPTGYFGSNCSQKCNCRNGTACDKDTGYCDEVVGLCDVGYVMDSVEFPSNCMTFSGCYGSCSKTCHCSSGTDDCNFLTGNCISSKCHPRWMGDKCQTDRFQTISEKTNPGVAIFHCSYTTPPESTHSSEYVKAAAGKFSPDHMISYVSSNVSETSINNSFWHEYLGKEEPIYCYVGMPQDQSGFAFVRLPPREFFVLPSYGGTPEIVESGYYHVVVSWRQWNSKIDTGDGPIVGYKIYVRLGTKVVYDEEVQPPGVGLPDSPERVLSKRSTDNATEMVTYNITELEAGSTYAIQIAAIRDGIKGEGESGPMLTVTTESLPVTLTTPISTDTSSQDGSGTGSSLVSAAAGGAVGAILLILIVIIVVIIVFKRRRNGTKSPAAAGIKDHDISVDLQDTSIDGENEYSGRASVSNPEQAPPRSMSHKPPVAARPSRRETDLFDPDFTAGSSGKSGVKPLTSRQPISTAQFPTFVNANRHTELFWNEFRELPGADIYPQTVAREKINYTKNRYKNILPYDSARVKLDVINSDPHSDYFNASFIPSFENDKAFIASQGPNKDSTNDFWRMIWQENVTTIAMVTRLREGDKIKCRQYWPSQQGDSVTFGNIKVELILLEPCNGGVKRKMTMRKNEDYRTVTQFHFRVWPDKGVPKHTSLLLKFIKEVKSNHGQNPHPLVIHCSAGVGRTGVVISIDSIVAHAKRTGMVDVFSFVTKIRQNRPYMVQTQEQYAFIYAAVLEDLLWKDTAIPLIHFSAHLQDLHASADEYGLSKMTKEFETLKSLCPDPPASQTRSGRTPENHHKNRYGNNLPLQRNRVMVDSPDNDYINASYVKGVHCNFLTTQMPMPNTVADFCCMILTIKPSIVVMLNDKSQDDKSCAQYWSDQGEARFGSYTVAILSISSDDDMIVRQLVITSDINTNHTVTQYQFLGWPSHGSDPRSGAWSLLKLIRAVKGSITNKKDFSLLVHCLSGVGRTGVFCSVLECIAQMEESDSVDIFQTVKFLRADRMQFVQTEEEYSFIYEVINAYMSSENYEQLPYPIDDHTYGNVETDDYALDPEENPYEVTDPQDGGATALVYSNTDMDTSGRSRGSRVPKPQETYSVYENMEFKS